MRPILDHAGDRCRKTLETEIGRTERRGTATRYLDIGCGDGTLSHAIAAYLKKQGGVTVTGLDISPSQLRAAQEAFGSDAIKFALVNEAFEDFAPTDKFDLITSIHSFYVIDEAYLRGVHELLAPHGIAFIWLAMRQDNVVTSLCDALDNALRVGQRRNAAEDIEAYAKRAGLSQKMIAISRPISGLLDEKGKPTAHGRKLINYCALRPMDEAEKGWDAAVAALHATRSDSGNHPLNDGLLVIRRHD